LAEEFEVSRRTAQRDIEYMRDQLQWPIEYSHERRGYLADGQLPFSDAVITEGDLVAVLVAIPLLEHYQGPSGRRLRQIFVRLCQDLSEKIEVRLADLDQCFSVRTSALPLVDPAILECLQEAIRRRRSVNITYTSRSRNSIKEKRRIDPYHLTYADGHCYTLGRCHKHDQVRVFAAWRISVAKLSENEFEIDPAFRPQEYFDGSFRVFRAEEKAEKINVLLAFSNLAADLLRERTLLAESARSERPDGRLEIHLKLAAMDEVIHFILSHGADCEVLAPNDLRRRVLEHARRILERG
jgi:predicted DNA-binding transcriptional regulator YafY